MKKTLVMLACAALVAPAFADGEIQPVVIDLFTASGSSLVSSTGVLIGGNSHTGSSTESSAITANATYATLSAAITTDLKWYADRDQSNVDNGALPSPNTATLVTDGPGAASGHVGAIAFSYTLSQSLVSSLVSDTTISLAFDVSVSGGNNNQKNQAIAARLMSAYGSSDIVTYSNTEGVNTAPAKLTVTLNEDVVNSMIASGTSQKLILLVSDTDNISGTNEAWRLSSMKLSYVPEPATATLSLMVLAGLAARRKRR